MYSFVFPIMPNIGKLLVVREKIDSRITVFPNIYVTNLLIALEPLVYFNARTRQAGGHRHVVGDVVAKRAHPRIDIRCP